MPGSFNEFKALLFGAEEAEVVEEVAFTVADLLGKPEEEEEEEEEEAEAAEAGQAMAVEPETAVSRTERPATKNGEVAVARAVEQVGAVAVQLVGSRLPRGCAAC